MSVESSEYLLTAMTVLLTAERANRLNEDHLVFFIAIILMCENGFLISKNIAVPKEDLSFGK